MRKYLIEQLETLHEENPKTYWALLDQLKNEESISNKAESNINVDDWFKYFKTLNTDIVQNQDRLILEKLNKLENSKIFNELDYKIKDSEITKAIKSL